jgi:hypothetical protein
MTFCFGMRSSRRINFSFLRFGLRLVNSPAGAFFLFFGLLTSTSLYHYLYQASCSLRTLQRLFHTIRYLRNENSSASWNRDDGSGIVLRPCWSSNETILCFDFGPYFGDVAQGWLWKCRAISPRAAGCDLFARKQNAHAI